MREITQERIDRNLRFLEDVYKLSNKKFTNFIVKGTGTVTPV